MQPASALVSRCLLWSIPHGATAGNVLRTGVLASVLAAVPDVRIVLLSPLSADPAFVREFAHPRVSFDVLPPHAPAGFEGRLLGVIQASFLTVCKTDTLRIRASREFPGAKRWRRAQASVGPWAGSARPFGRLVRARRSSGPGRGHGAAVRPLPPLAGRDGFTRPDLLGNPGAAHRAARRRSHDGGRSELGQSDQQVSAAAPGGPAGGLECDDARRGAARSMATISIGSRSPGRRSSIPTSRGPRSSRADFCRPLGLDPARRI